MSKDFKIYLIINFQIDEIDDSSLKALTYQGLLDLADGAVIFSAHATIPVELGGFNTLAAVDVAARCNIPVMDADGAGRAVPEVHLKVYTIDSIPLASMVVADLHAKT